jgi:DNA processing protein
VARALLAAFGSAEGVLSADPKALREVVGPAASTALSRPPEGLQDRLVAARAWLQGDAAAGSKDVGERYVLTLGDPAYPEALLQTADPPLWLFVQGQVQALNTRRSLAVVGSRRPTPQGADHARRFAAELGAAGWTVVSGLAQGVDGAAHEGALSCGATTVAVMGTGPDRIYPARHLKLARRIAAQGALVSEFPPGTPPLAQNFPQRNRIIAGLTRGTLVVEAALASGSLITARLAVEAGREVMAIPGAISSPQSQGCHALIKQGAQLVETLDDILQALGEAPVPPPGGAKPPAEGSTGAGPADIVLSALGHEVSSLDALADRTGMSTAALQARLLELELAGTVARLPGGRFQRRGQG